MYFTNHPFVYFPIILEEWRKISTHYNLLTQVDVFATLTKRMNNKKQCCYCTNNKRTLFEIKPRLRNSCAHASTTSSIMTWINELIAGIYFLFVSETFFYLFLKHNNKMMQKMLIISQLIKQFYIFTCDQFIRFQQKFYKLPSCWSG